MSFLGSLFQIGGTVASAVTGNPLWAFAGNSIGGSMNAKDAASTQAAGQQQAAATQQAMFDKLQANQQPYMQAGYGALHNLTDLMGTTGTPGWKVGDTGLPQGYLTQTFDPNNLNGNPAYQFALKTGGQAIRNADTPGVGALSGAALKDLMAFNVGTANQYENQYFNQFQTQQNNIYQRLSAIAGLGENAAAGVGNNGTQLGTGIAQAQAAAAGSQAGGIVGASNALGGGATTLAGLMMQGGNGGYTYTTPGDAQNVGPPEPSSTPYDPYGPGFGTGGGS